jgi:hypothetical protein
VLSLLQSFVLSSVSFIHFTIPFPLLPYPAFPNVSVTSTPSTVSYLSAFLQSRLISFPLFLLHPRRSCLTVNTMLKWDGIVPSSVPSRSLIWCEVGEVRGAKVNSVLCYISKYCREDVWWSGGTTPPFLISALDGGECRSASRPCRFTPGDGAASTHWVVGWVGLRAGLDAMEKRINPYPCRESNPGRAAHSLVAVPTELSRMKYHIVSRGDPHSFRMW